MNKYNVLMNASYLTLYQSGELRKRVEALEALASPCRLCPWECRVNRVDELGKCLTGLPPVVASHTPHFGEEPPLSGTKGSGTVFLANCNLKCVYCQNHEISQGAAHRKYAAETHAALADKMLGLQAQGCHNINWVSPTHQAAALARALFIAVGKGLNIPIVYNSNGYDSVEALRLWDGVVDIYLPDLKYADAETGRKLSGPPDYPRKAREALTEMFRQVGERWVMEKGVMTRGLLVRLLVLPGRTGGTEKSLRWIAENLSPGAGVSLMSQYNPSHRAGEPAFVGVVGRRVNAREWRSAVGAHERWMKDEKGFVQDLELAPGTYRPDFKNTEKPFADIDLFRPPR